MEGIDKKANSIEFEKFWLLLQNRLKMIIPDASLFYQKCSKIGRGLVVLFFNNS